MPKGLLYLLVFLLTFALTAVGPWWFTAAIPFLLALSFRLSLRQGFWAGFLLIGSIWTLLILFRDAQNQQILAQKMATIFGMPTPVFLMMNILIGAVMGAAAGMAGGMIAQAFRTPKKSHAV